MLEAVGGFFESVGIEAVIAMFATAISLALAWVSAKFGMNYKRTKLIAEALVDLLDTIVASVEDDKVTRAELKTIMEKAKEAVVLFRAGQLEVVVEDEES